MSTQIDRDEWLKALGEAFTPCDPAAVTVMELGALFGMGREWSYRRILKLIKDGKAERTFKQVAGPSGVSKRVPAYRLLTSAPAPPAKKK